MGKAARCEASRRPAAPRAALSTLAAALVLAATCAGPAAAGEPGSDWVRARPGTLPDALVQRTVRVTLPRSIPASLRRRAFNAQIVEAARKAGVDPALVHAVVSVESAYNPGAVSPKGAVGLMQVVPGTGRRFGVEDLLDPGANLRAGTRYLSYLMRLFEGDVRLALAAYNAGENAVLRHGRTIPPYRETRGYVPRVLGIYDALLARSETAPALPPRPAPE